MKKKKISQLDLHIKDKDLLENLQKFVDEVRDYSKQNFSKASPTKRKLSFAEEDKTVKKKQKQNNNANFDDVKDKYKEMHLFLIQCLSGCVSPLEKVEKDDENFFGGGIEAKYILIDGTHIGKVNKKLTDGFQFEMALLPNCENCQPLKQDMQYKVKRNRCLYFHFHTRTNILDRSIKEHSRRKR